MTSTERRCRVVGPGVNDAGKGESPEVEGVSPEEAEVEVEEGIEIEGVNDGLDGEES